ncbi:MAG: DUF7768 domain-containing protein [Pseudolabrys sp.]
MNITEQFPVVFTAQSKAYFYCRDAVCEYVFSHKAVPVNPFRVFEYFLGDRVDRNLVRTGNNNLIRIVDELWVFGETIANGVLFEIRFAKELGKPIKYFTIDTLAKNIRPISPYKLKFERELLTSSPLSKDDLIAEIVGTSPAQLSLFEGAEQ